MVQKRAEGRKHRARARLAAAGTQASPSAGGRADGGRILRGGGRAAKLPVGRGLVGGNWLRRGQPSTGGEPSDGALRAQ